MSWFQRVKDQARPMDVARWLGLEPGAMSSVGPCPVCRAEERGADDSRGPIGIGGKGGWQCFRCGAKGDVIELAAQAMLGVSSESLDAEGAERLRTWFAEQGVDVEDGPGAARGDARGRSGGRQQGRTTPSVHEVVHGRPRERRKAEHPAPETEPPPGAPEGTYAWTEDLVPRCEVALWGTSAEAALAREYLIGRRGLGEASLRVLRIGLYVHPDGSPWRVDGRPVVVIPLQDEHARPVNVKFRSVPVVGTCQHCDSPDGCKKCRSYRACRGRPLPLFGAHLLSEDRTKPVVVVEGELDMVAMHTLGFRANVVSTTAGAGTAWSDAWLDAVEPYSTILGLYDDDEAGIEGWGKASATLGPERCSRAVPPGGKDVNSVLIAGLAAGTPIPEIAQQVLRSLALATPAHGMAMRRADEYADDIEVLISDPGRLRGTRTGSAKLDHALGGWRPGVIVVSGETGNGKAQPLDEPVLTPSGWRPIGDLRVGDEVTAPDGSTTTVTGVYPQGVRPVARVEFNDGAWTRCDPEHLWKIGHEHSRSVVLSTWELAIRLASPISDRAWFIPPFMDQPARFMRSIRHDGFAECVCIQVAHPSHLYVTRDHIVTHNTTLTTWLSLEQARMGEPVMITSFEQRPIGSVQKLLRAQVGGDFTHVSESTRRDALAALSELDLFILDHYGQIPLEKLVEAIKYAKRRQGVRFFMVDHLGFLVDPDARDERLEIQRVMRTLAILAKVENVCILLVCHVANFEAAPGKPASRPTMRNLKGGSAIRQDADEVIIVVSKPASKSEKREYPVSELHLDKVRSEFGTTGACVRLAFDPGATTYADTWEETPAGQAGKIVPR